MNETVVCTNPALCLMEFVNWEGKEKRKEIGKEKGKEKKGGLRRNDGLVCKSCEYRLSTILPLPEVQILRKA